ncbi:hypothetical protein ACHAQH_006424 [Verticillium albo-atrum]
MPADTASSGLRPRSLGDFKVIVSKRDGFVPDYTEVHRIYSEFQKAETGIYHKQGTSERLPEFAKEKNIQPQDLHEVALRLSDFGPPTKAEFEFQHRLFDAASELGHVPATLHIVRAVLFGKNPEVLPRSCPRAYARFKTLVAAGRNPDALTLQGKFHAVRGERDLAAELFRRAKDIAGADGRGSQWKNLAQLELARLHEAAGAARDAYLEYREVADAGDAEGCYYLATLDERIPGVTRLVSEAEAKDLLTQAAMAGHPVAPAALADIETSMYDRAVAGGDEDAAAGHLLDAQEWRNLVAALKVRDPKNYEVY